MAENKKAVSLDELSHFKAKQDLYNANTFQKKGENDLGGAVRYDVAQALTEEQKAQARFNIGISSTGGGGTAEGAVRYDVEQSLDDDDKARARENIGTTDGTWENMPDKPFYKTGVSYEWDGNTEGLEKLCLVEGLDFYKISSDVLSQDELLGASLKSYFDGDDIEGEITQDGSISIVQTSAGNLMVLSDGALPVLCVFSHLGEDALADLTFTVESTGLWFLHSTGEKEYTQYLRKNYSIKKIDKEFLPDDLNVELPDGIVTTDESGLIPASVLPSYVDDVVEGYYNGANTFYEQYYEELGDYGVEITPESGKIYVDLNTGNTYRWSGSTYVRLNPDEITFATTSDIDEFFN
jgi:hypothetical protein